MKRKSQQNSLKTALHSIDLFPLDMNFRENGQESFTTWCGTLLSLAILIVVGIHFVVKL